MTPEKTIFYNGIEILTGISSHPHSDIDISSHDYEYSIFQKVLDEIKNKDNPIMVELGCWWAFWSLCFKKRFPKGRNILIELGKRQLSIGLKNFKLNGFDETHYWGGLFIDDSGSYKTKKDSYMYPKKEGEYWDDSIDGEIIGTELDFVEIYNSENLNTIDLLHMDIQGSELPLLIQLHSHKLLQNKIENVVIATHSILIHNELYSLLINSGFRIVKNERFGSVGGDGMIIASKSEIIGDNNV